MRKRDNIYVAGQMEGLRERNPTKREKEEMEIDREKTDSEKIRKKNK